MSVQVEDGYVIDENNNRASIERFGSLDAATLALLSCAGCYECEDCENCQSCRHCDGCRSCEDCRSCGDCENCENIKGCNGCRDCRGCEGCEGCNGCRGCENCRYCHGSQDCRDCQNCQNCRGCRGCRGCHGCRDCEDCRGCLGCEDCENCESCQDCRDCESCQDCVGEREQHVAPVIDHIHQQVYAAASAPGSLDMSHWHSQCGTTHCRAGWVVHLAGEAGRKLEQDTSTAFAAMQIYKASGYRISPVRFYDSKHESLAEMKRLAEAEAEAETV